MNRKSESSRVIMRLARELVVLNEATIAAAVNEKDWDVQHKLRSAKAATLVKVVSRFVELTA